MVARCSESVNNCRPFATSSQSNLLEALQKIKTHPGLKELAINETAEIMKSMGPRFIALFNESKGEPEFCCGNPHKSLAKISDLLNRWILTFFNKMLA